MKDPYLYYFGVKRISPILLARICAIFQAYDRSFSSLSCYVGAHAMLIRERDAIKCKPTGHAH